MTLRIAAAVLALTVAAGAAHARTEAQSEAQTGTKPAAAQAGLMVDYNIDQTVRGADDDREILSQIYLNGENLVGYRYREIVHGATTPLVRTLDFSNDPTFDVTPAQQEALIRALTEAGAFDLKDEAYDDASVYDASLRVRTADRTLKLRFHTPPDGARLAVHKVLLDFAHQLDIDHPRTPGAEHLSEGDRVPAAEVALAELLARPDAFDGKRVRVTGYYLGAFEGQTVCADKAAAQENRYDQCLWRGEASTFADSAQIASGNDQWQTIEGVFVKGPGGHLGQWPGSIERLTRVEGVAAPAKP